VSEFFAIDTVRKTKIQVPVRKKIMVPGKYNVARARGTEEVGGLPGTGSGIKRQLVPVFIRREFVYQYGTAKIMVPEV